MNTILLGNLIKIRWIAIFGQVLAVIFVYFVLKIQIPFFEILSIILLSVAVNIYSYYEERKNKSISNLKAFSYLSFSTMSSVCLSRLFWILSTNKEATKETSARGSIELEL